MSVSVAGVLPLAPGPEQLLSVCRNRSWERQSRFVTIWVLFGLLSLFYTIPIGAIQAIIEVDRLDNIVVFKQLVSVPFVRSLIEAFLPGEGPPTAQVVVWPPATRQEQMLASREQGLRITRLKGHVSIVLRRPDPIPSAFQHLARHQGG